MDIEYLTVNATFNYVHARDIVLALPDLALAMGISAILQAVSNDHLDIIRD